MQRKTRKTITPQKYAHILATSILGFVLLGSGAACQKSEPQQKHDLQNNDHLELFSNVAKQLKSANGDLKLTDEQRKQIHAQSIELAKKTNEDPAVIEEKILKMHKSIVKLTDAQDGNDIKKVLMDMNKDKIAQHQLSADAKKILKGIYTGMIAYQGEYNKFDANIDFWDGKKGPRFEDENFVYTIKTTEQGFRAFARAKAENNKTELVITFAKDNPGQNGQIKKVEVTE